MLAKTMSEGRPLIPSVCTPESRSVEEPKIAKASLDVLWTLPS